jgi:hypothetical protein
VYTHGAGIDLTTESASTGVATANDEITSAELITRDSIDFPERRMTKIL